MGWNIFYKECKYLAAHRILRELNTDKKEYKFYPENSDTPSHEISAPQQKTLKELKKKIFWFDKEIIKDVLFMLYDSNPDPHKKEIDLLNSGVRDEIRCKILPDGQTALKDRKYIRKFFSSAKIITPILIAIATVLIGTIRCIFH